MVALNGSPVNGAAVDPSTLVREGADFAVIEMSWTDQHLLDSPRAADHAAPSAADSWPCPESEQLQAERARLEAEIAAATERAAGARARVAVHRAEIRANLHAEITAVRESFAEMQRQHDAAVAAVRATAQVDVERILSEARRLAGVQRD